MACRLGAVTLCFSLLFALIDIRGAQARNTTHNRVFVPVLIYHHVKWLKPSDDAIERGLTVLPNQFSAELTYLDRAHYHTITAARVVAYLRQGKPLPPHPVVLSFDDGYTDIYGGAYAMLRRHHMTATFFIVPGFLGSARYMTWREIEDMEKHGMDIESHTMSHPDLTRVPAAQLRGELAQSRAELHSHLHRPIQLLAYPYGTYNPAVLRAVGRAGYIAAFTTHQGWWEDRSDLLTLPRVYVDLDDTLAIFAGRLRADPRVLAQDPV